MSARRVSMNGAGRRGPMARGTEGTEEETIMKREKERLEALRRLSYEEYLQTPEWEEIHKAALTRAGKRCQVCNTNDGSLSAYHTTFESLGCEQENDLIVLCEGCYDLFHQHGKLACLDDASEDAEEEEARPSPAFSLTQKAAIFVPAAITGLALPALLHAPLPAEVFGVAAAFALAANSPKMYGAMRDSLPAPLADFLDGMIERKHARAATGEWSNWDRLVGRHMGGNDPRPTQADDERGGTQEPEPQWRPGREEMPGDELPLPPSIKKGTFVLSSVLEQFTPTLDRIYLASTMDGLELYCPAEHLCHVALAGSTDGGKSSIIRMLMAQLCKAGAQVLLLNPHYTRYDIKKQEDWTPFEPYLFYDPMECRKYEVIEHYLKYTAETLLPRRLDKYAHSLPTGKPYFIVMDELPSIIKRIPKATGWLGELLREGRKVGIFLISASQDFLVKTIAPDGSGGAVRDCYRTAYYVGGDATTAKTLLDMPARDIPEDELGQGRVMVRCARSLEAKKAIQARVPYGDNAALYRLLGPSTYQPSRVSGPSLEYEALPTPAAPENVTPHLTLVREEAQMTSYPGHATDTARRRASIPAELRAAVQAYLPGMSYRDLGRALGWGDGEARVVWQEMKKRGLLHHQAQQPSLRVANGGQSASYPSAGQQFSASRPQALSQVVADRHEQAVQLGKDVFLSQEQFTVALKLRKSGMSTGYRDLMSVFDLSEHHAKELNKRIRQALGQAPERESERASE